MFKRVNHIGIAVKNMDEAREAWQNKFGVKAPPPVTRGDMQICMMKLGDILVELMSPLGNEGIIARFLQKHGEGFHHICYEVEDIFAASKELLNRGVDLVDKEPREGEEGKIMFLHPKGTQGVLTEIVQVRE